MELGAATLSLLLNSVLLASSQSPNMASFQPVLLKVSDQIGVERIGEMICSGVPFAQGVLSPEQSVRVQDAEGNALPTQSKLLGQWPDGSVKWLLIQFSADCEADSERLYYLAPGNAPEPDTPLIVEDEADRIFVDTGAIQAAVSKGGMTLLADVFLKKKSGMVQALSGGTPMEFILEDGSVHTSNDSEPELVTLEENGPLRATVHVVGWLQGPEKEKLYKLDTRLRFYAGQSKICAEYTFICLGQPPLHHVREIVLEISPRMGKNAEFTLPSGKKVIKGALSEHETAILSADTEMVCRVGLEGEEKTAEWHLDGWGILTGSEISAGVVVRDFWHLCPKSIEIASDRIRIALWSGRAGKILNLGRTRAKTHHILYDFRPSTESEGAKIDRLRAFQSPLIATTEPEYFCSTDALNTLSPSGAPETSEYDSKIDQSFQLLRRQRETLPLENGMLHYGDYYHGGYGNEATRGDLEYDTGHSCFLFYARSGRRDYYDFAVACNQHFIDIDVNQENGEQRFHGYSENAETHEAVTTGLEWGHLFVDCAADAYYLTGDERSFRTVGMIADSILSIADGEGYDKLRGLFASAERHLGWPLLTLCRAYEVTGDEKYMEASHKIVDYIKLYAKDPLAAYRDGKWWRSWMMDGCKVFMTGQLHDGLAAYYNITQDEEIKDVIVTSLNWLIDQMWNPEANGFAYEFNAMNRPHRQEGITSLNMLAVDAFRFGYEITGDRRYLSVATRAFWGQVKDMKPMEEGKQFSIEARTSAHTAAYFYREHISPHSLPEAPQPIKLPPASQIPAPKRAEVLLHADFEGDLVCGTPEGKETGQAVGQIEFVPGRNGGQAVSVGKNGYAWLPAPPDMLSMPGSIELWVQLHFKKKPLNPGQRSVFHIEGESPLIDSLCACTIYSEMRIRMKNHIGHLNGTAEGEIADWEPGEWHHLVVTWDDKYVKLYLDGKEQTRPDEGKHAGDLVNGLTAGKQTKINLGWRFGNWYCDCAIDELTVHNRALTPREVEASYSAD